jgi:mannose-1-phosphate guanylyltransferase
MHVVILAGGVGTRLWPISRRSRPKPFQPLLSARPMVVETYDRVAPLTSPDRVWVVTGAEFVDLVRTQLGGIPSENILGEPMRRNSAPATALAVARIARSAPDAIVLVTPADSHIGDPAAYRDYVAAAAGAAAAGFIVTLGVVPSHPDTGYGYIQRGERLEVAGGAAYRVARFTEKPDRQTAEQYLAGGGYYWNMGHFIFRAQHFMERCAHHLPEVAAGARALAEHQRPSAELLARVYRDLPATSLDYGIAEKERDMAVVPTALEWSDVGNWRAVRDIARRHGGLDLRPERHVGIDSEDCLVMAGSDRLVVTVGLEGCIIVDTPDALLVVHADKAQEVREALAEIERRGKQEYL